MQGLQLQAKNFHAEVQANKINSKKETSTCKLRRSLFSYPLTQKSCLQKLPLDRVVANMFVSFGSARLKISLLALFLEGNMKIWREARKRINAPIFLQNCGEMLAKLLAVARSIVRNFL